MRVFISRYFGIILNQVSNFICGIEEGEIKLAEIEREQEKLDSLSGSDFALTFRGSRSLAETSVHDEVSGVILWPLPSNAVISTKGRKIVGRDPNISSATLKSLLVSESAYIPESLRDRLLTSTPRQIAQEEFIDTFELGATHLALCIEQDLAQTKADLIANYSDDRRLPFVVGAIYIDAYLRYFKPFYYCFYPQDGYLRTEWKPRKIYMQPKNKLPPEKHEFKKYYKVGKSPVADIMPCPACGRPARLFRAGFRGKESQVCCTDPTEQCSWFLGRGIFNNEAEAIRIWNEMCLNRST